MLFDDSVVTGSPACSASAKMQETGAASEVSTTENIMDRTRAHAPANDALLHGRVRLCRSCGCETTNDRVCDDCSAAWREERGAALGDLCRQHGVHLVEDLPAGAMAAFRAEWGRC